MKKTISIILTIALCLIMILPTFAYANNEIQPDKYKGIYTKEGSDTEALIKSGGKVLGFVQVIGVSCGVIMLLILGIKYIYMSHDADDKAKIKEKLIPYVIGAVLLFGGSGLLGLVANFAQNMDSDAPANNSSYNQSTNYTVCPNCGGPYNVEINRCIKCYYTI